MMMAGEGCADEEEGVQVKGAGDEGVELVHDDVVLPESAGYTKQEVTHKHKHACK